MGSGDHDTGSTAKITGGKGKGRNRRDIRIDIDVDAVSGEDTGCGLSKGIALETGVS